VGDVGTAGHYGVQIRATYALFDATIELSWIVHPQQSATTIPALPLVGVAPDEAAWLAASEAGGALGTAAYQPTTAFDAAGAAAAVAATVPALATQAQTDAGSSSAVFVSPSTLSSYRKLLRVLRFGQALFPWAGVWDGVEWVGGGRKTDTDNTTQNSKMRFITKFACSDLRLMYANVYDSETYTPNDIVIRVALELATGTVVPVFFSGKRSVTIEGGGFAISDPISVKLAAGDYIYPRTFLTVANATDDWPQQRARLFDAGERTERGVGLADMSLTGTIGTGSQFAYGPIAVGATLPNAPANVALFGDSIIHGQGESADPANFGFASRALNGKNPYLRLARPGEQASQFEVAGLYIRGSLAISSDYAICNYGLNDLIASASVATLQADLVAAWTLLTTAGLSVYQCTLTPKTSSTDTWATTANQTPNLPDEARRVTINDWIRTTPAPLSGYFETADAVESARNSGLWKPLYTNDGTHPLAIGHAAMAATIDTSLFI
jgi:lysophospholipase L1-like esterase